MKFRRHHGVCCVRLFGSWPHDPGILVFHLLPFDIRVGPGSKFRNLPCVCSDAGVDEKMEQIATPDERCATNVPRRNFGNQSVAMCNLDLFFHTLLPRAGSRTICVGGGDPVATDTRIVSELDGWSPSAPRRGSARS